MARTTTQYESWELLANARMYAWAARWHAQSVLRMKIESALALHRFKHNSSFWPKQFIWRQK